VSLYKTHYIDFISPHPLSEPKAFKVSENPYLPGDMITYEDDHTSQGLVIAVLDDIIHVLWSKPPICGQVNMNYYHATTLMAKHLEFIDDPGIEL
jgi:hypothetical protein